MAISQCLITGVVSGPDGLPLQNVTITFNTLKTQVVSNETVAPLIITATTDSTGTLSAISLAQGIYCQVTIEGAAPYTVVVPLSLGTTFAALSASVFTIGQGLRGSVTLSAGAGTVTFGSAETTATYAIALGGSADEAFWWSSRTVNGFAIQSSNGDSTATVTWIMIR